MIFNDSKSFDPIDYFPEDGWVSGRGDLSRAHYSVSGDYRFIFCVVLQCFVSELTYFHSL